MEHREFRIRKIKCANLVSMHGSLLFLASQTCTEITALESLVKCQN